MEYWRMATNGLARPLRENYQPALFDRGTDWESEWWGMPHFSMGDARPQHKITVNFMSAEDLSDFASKTGLPVSTRTDSTWFPHQEALERESYYYDGPPTKSRYPVCIPSKGRADCQKTGKALKRMGVSETMKAIVEEYEATK